MIDPIGRPLNRRAFASLLAGLAVAPRAAFAREAENSEAPASTSPVSIEVRARPIASFDPRDRSHVRFGALQFRSGLILTSSYRRFGGLSALWLDGAGRRFVMASDRGHWFTGRIDYDGGELAGLADVESAPMLDQTGERLAKSGLYDSEAIAFDDRYAYVAFERVNEIVRFDFKRDGIRARGEKLATPSAMRSLPNNLGIEGLVVAPASHPTPGALIAVSERSLDSLGNIQGFIIGGKRPGVFGVRRSQEFDIADAALLPDGDLLLLERKFSMLTGVAIRIRRIPIASVVPGAVLDGTILFDVDFGHEIDNMEGIATHRDASGATIVTLVSDDNFSLLQRTLLLQFALIEE